MSNKFPGTTVEVVRLTKGSSRSLFQGIFAAGGITLSQVSVMTGLEPYQIQNWVKRGFLTSPVKRMYAKEQFARVIIINMLKESLQLERICDLIRVIIDVPVGTGEGRVSDDELYHRYVDMLAEGSIDIGRVASVHAAALRAVGIENEKHPTAVQAHLVSFFEAMVYAHAASELGRRAADIIAGLT